jgi:hypothetical protein
MCENTTAHNENHNLRLHAKQEQIKLIDMILEGLCTSELSHEGRQFIKNLRQNLKFEIETLTKTVSDEIQDRSKT